MIGQERLLQELNNYTIETLPRSILLLGEQGCGKHTVVKNLADRLGLQLVAIDEKVTFDQLEEYSMSFDNTMYLIDLPKFTEKQQNQFLKFVEEPSKTMFIVAIAQSEIGVLPTLANRCAKFHFADYSAEELKQFCSIDLPNDCLLFQVCRTPGKILSTNTIVLDNMATKCAAMIKQLDKMPYANMLKMSTMINYKDLYDKLDFDTAFDLLSYLTFENYTQTGASKSLIAYNITTKFKQEKDIKPVNKEIHMLSFLTTLWKETR